MTKNLMRLVVLDAEDPLAYGDLMGTIAEAGDCLVVDAYLRVDQMRDLIQHTSARRFLVGPKITVGEITQMGVLLQTAAANYPQRSGVAFELRRSPDLHDRWVVGESEVYGLGISINGVGKKPSTLVKYPYEQSEAIRGLAEKVWAQAVDPRQGQRTGADAIRFEDGVYRHGACPVRHQSPDTASRCPKK